MNISGIKINNLLKPKENKERFFAKNNNLSPLKKDTVSFGTRNYQPQRATVDQNMTKIEKKVENIMAALKEGKNDGEVRAEIKTLRDIVDIYQYFGWLYDYKTSDIFLRSPYGGEYHFSTANKNFSVLVNALIGAMREVDNRYGELVPEYNNNARCTEGWIDFSVPKNEVRCSDGVFLSRNRYREKIEAKLEEQKTEIKIAKKAIEESIKTQEKLFLETGVHKTEIFRIADKYDLFGRAARKYLMADIDELLNEIAKEAKDFIPKPLDDKDVLKEKQTENDILTEKLLDVCKETQEIMQTLTEIETIITFEDEYVLSDEEKAVFDEKIGKFVAALHDSKILKTRKIEDSQDKKSVLQSKIDDLKEKAEFLNLIYIGYVEGEDEEANKIALLLYDIDDYKKALIKQKEEIKAQKAAEIEQTETVEKDSKTIVQKEKPTEQIQETNIEQEETVEKITKEKLIALIEEAKQQDIPARDKGRKILEVFGKTNIIEDDDTFRLAFFAECEVIKLFLPDIQKAIDAGLIEKRYGGVLVLDEAGIDKYYAKKINKVDEYKKTGIFISKCLKNANGIQDIFSIFNYEEYEAKVKEYGISEFPEAQRALELFKNAKDYFFRNYKNLGAEATDIWDIKGTDPAVSRALQTYVENRGKSFGDNERKVNLAVCIEIAINAKSVIDELIESLQSIKQQEDQTSKDTNTIEKPVESQKAEEFMEAIQAQEKQKIEEKEQLTFNPNFEKQIISKIQQLAKFIVEKYPNSIGLIQDFYSLLMDNLTNEDIQKIENSKTQEEVKEIFKKLYLKIKNTEEFKNLTATKTIKTIEDRIRLIESADLSDIVD